jgi:ATP-dependent Clp protease adapter protein ClpS
MTKTQTQISLEDMQIDMVFHSFSANTLQEFMTKIVKPYFKGNLNQAVQVLMEKALTEESLFNQAIKG